MKSLILSAFAALGLCLCGCCSKDKSCCGESCSKDKAACSACCADKKAGTCCAADKAPAADAKK